MGLIFICGGGVVFFTALFTIKTLESYDGNLITKGIYSKIRHPMYTGFIMWLTGFPLFYGGRFLIFTFLSIHCERFILEASGRERTGKKIS